MKSRGMTKRKNKNNYHAYMRSKVHFNRARRLKMLGSMVHWIGFFCLVTSLLLLLIAGLNDRIEWLSIFDSVLDVIFDEENLGYLHSGDEPGFWILWLTVTHWPIKFILSGNKALLPWTSD